VPIAFLSDNIEQLKEVGEEIASVIKDSDNKNSTMLLASSDMTNY
jgi:AmmeMemoRadiSam system protein B